MNVKVEKQENSKIQQPKENISFKGLGSTMANMSNVNKHKQKLSYYLLLNCLPKENQSSHLVKYILKIK